jgi:hypothetical protein
VVSDQQAALIERNSLGERCLRSTKLFAILATVFVDSKGVVERKFALFAPHLAVFCGRVY